MTQTIANRYRIVREIARSNDIVYEARDDLTGRRVAIKELLVPPNLTGDARADRVARFRREARAAQKLDHPNIVTVYLLAEEAGKLFLIMEYLEGAPLRDALQSGMPMPMAQALDIARQALSGLQHAHGRHVIHRDVKPDNIHILPTGMVKLTDFGIARLTEEASLTSDGQVFGTPSYMSPEQILGKVIDHRTDLFSLGVVLYEMLSGRKPFTGDSIASVTHSIMYSSPDPVFGLPSALASALDHALQKDPAQRWDTAQGMITALVRVDVARSPQRIAPAAACRYIPSPSNSGSEATTVFISPAPAAGSLESADRSAAKPDGPASPRPSVRTGRHFGHVRGVITALIAATAIWVGIGRLAPMAGQSGSRAGTGSAPPGAVGSPAPVPSLDTPQDMHGDTAGPGAPRNEDARGGRGWPPIQTFEDKFSPENERIMADRIPNAVKAARRLLSSDRVPEARIQLGFAKDAAARTPVGTSYANELAELEAEIANREQPAAGNVP